MYACINGGGNHPRRPNKETVSSELTVGFSRDPTNGRVTGATSPPIGPQPVGAFSCPSGQTLVQGTTNEDDGIWQGHEGGGLADRRERRP